tara:strand:- start:33 stop:587 length:555 start_codon:yes stop_codon:yes gene_type:complete
LLLNIEYEKIVNVIKCFSEARKCGSDIIFIGNGGSAATASHFAQDLAGVGRKTGKQGFRSRSLTDNTSFITAMGNDYGYESIFTCQMRNLFNEGDVLVAISASGNSQNVVEAVKLAKKMGGISIGLIGFDGGKLLDLCDHVIHVVSDKGEYGPVEDIHLMLGHMITSYFMCNDENPKSESFIDE